MPSLDKTFDELVGRLAAPGSLAATGADPFFYFAFDPRETLEVRSRLPAWEGRLRNAGFDVERVSFADLIWDLVDASGRWEAWLEAEPDAELEQVNAAIADVLGSGDRLVERVGEIVGRSEPRSVALFTETELLHPYFRVGTLENRLHDDRIRRPTVVFYPGRRDGQSSLRFLDLYSGISHYRATVLGGMA
jgi:hypothetical protein